MSELRPDVAPNDESVRDALFLLGEAEQAAFEARKQLLEVVGFTTRAGLRWSHKSTPGRTYSYRAAFSWVMAWVHP